MRSHPGEDRCTITPPEQLSAATKRRGQETLLLQVTHGDGATLTHMKVGMRWQGRSPAVGRTARGWVFLLLPVFL